MKKVLFISSTGGHLSELLKLEPLFKSYNYHIITEKNETNKYLIEKFGKDKISYLPYCTRSKFFRYIFIYSYLILKSIYLYIKIRPEIIVTTGTHTVVPICYIGKLFKNKIIYIETFANINKATLTGKIVYPIADLFLVQWEKMLEIYPKAIFIGEGKI